MKYTININDEKLSVILQNSLSKNRFIYYKRIIDLFVILLLSPLAFVTLLFGILVVKFSSKGPIFFIQKRVGLNGEVFKIYKLRTMVHKSDNYDISHTIEDDQRIYSMGKLLRLSKIDEIPQFLNILKGEMSLIGPRPEREDIVKDLTYNIPNYKLRHLVRPGLSGLAQIHNPKATPNQSIEKLEYDLYYINNLDINLECKIYWETFFIILKLNSL
jgi:lipopolysaccharide/colanic/teichoic acid biosynthesis glycosyltransferase